MEQTIMSSETGTRNKEIGDIEDRSIVATVMAALSGAWQKTRAVFWRVESKLSADATRPLDIERLTTQLAVGKRAEEDGRQNMPPSDEEALSGTQREIIAHFSNLRRRARRQAASTAEKSLASLEKLQKSDHLATVRDIPAGCENKILRHVADVESQLNNAVEREQSQKQHYDAFRKENGLDRVAQYPRVSYRYHVVAAALIVATAMALSIIAGIFSGGNPGLSLVWIATVSVIAVAVPFIFGDSLLRWINHVGTFEAFLGWLGTMVVLMMIVGMASYTDSHVAAAHANPDTTSRDVIEAILVAPLDVVSRVSNWMGFGLVALTGLLAMLLGYRSDDPYPGYGAVQRSFYKARDTRDNAFARLRKKINALIDGSEAEIASIGKDFKSRVRTYTRLVEKSERDPSVLTEYDAELEDTCNIVLDRYRSANTAVRESAPPLSFTEHACFNPESEMDSRLHSDGRSHVAELQTATVELEKEAEVARQKLRDLNLRMINSITEPQLLDDESTS